MRTREREQRAREKATRYAWSYVGKWYKWGGDDPSGFDCSGLCLEILQGVGLFPRGGDTNSRGLYARFRDKEVAEPYEGCLVFYSWSGGRISHVEYCIDDETTIGASGGGSTTTSVAAAIAQNAFIKMRPINVARGRWFVDPFKGMYDA